MSTVSNQIRLGLGPTPESSMVVTWVTARGDLVAEAAAPVGGNDAAAGPAATTRDYLVFYAATLADLDAPDRVRTVVASSQVYNITDAVLIDFEYFNATSVYESPVIHHAVLEDLASQTTYFYQVSAEGGQRSRVMNFTTVSALGSLPTALGPSVTVICGDVGQTPHSKNTIAAILEHHGYTDLAAAGAVEFGIMVGDMSYADSNGTRWDTWGKMMEPLVSHFPMMFLVGNHEIDWSPPYDYAFTHYRNRFHMPGDYEREVWMHSPPQLLDNFLHRYNFSLQYEHGASYYSFDVGLVHYVALNSYSTFCTTGPGCPQYDFLDADLAAVNRDVTPWVVVTMHTPVYNSNLRHVQGTEVATVLFNAWVQPLLVQHKVNFVFAGHVHAYERFGHVDLDGRLDPDGRSPLYVTVGDGGNRELLYDAWDPAMEDISAFRNGQYYGYGTLLVYNASVARWEWRPNPAEGSAEDAVWVTNYAIDAERRTTTELLRSARTTKGVAQNTAAGESDAVAAGIVSAVLVVSIAIVVGIGFAVRSRRRNSKAHHKATVVAVR